MGGSLAGQCHGDKSVSQAKAFSIHQLTECYRVGAGAERASMYAFAEKRSPAMVRHVG